VGWNFEVVDKSSTEVLVRPTWNHQVVSASSNEQVDLQHRDLPLGSVLGNLPELLMAHLGSNERIALIVRAGNNRYVQFLATENQELILECVSNRFLDGDAAIGLEGELVLFQAGFRPPETDAEPRPNWWWRAKEGVGVMEACQMAAIAALEVFGLNRDSRVELIERPLPVRH
jgi:T3SS (YopN, CesT) and YbjN peptide-binding chaperone 3